MTRSYFRLALPANIPALDNPATFAAMASKSISELEIAIRYNGGMERCKNQNRRKKNNEDVKRCLALSAALK